MHTSAAYASTFTGHAQPFVSQREQGSGPETETSRDIKQVCVTRAWKISSFVWLLMMSYHTCTHVAMVLDLGSLHGCLKFIVPGH